MTNEVSPTYDEIMARCRKLAADADAVSFEEIGPSELGHPIPKLVLGDPDRDVPLLMVTGGTHGCEETGRAASMALAEWLANDGADYLKKLNAIIIPCVNPDGAIQNTYHNGKNVNIYTSYGYNRESTTAEGRAVEAVATEMMPDCYVDTHGLAGGAMGGSEYIHPTLPSSMGMQIAFAIATEMDIEALRNGIPQRHPRLHGTFKAEDGSLADKLASMANTLSFTVEITEKYYPLADSITSGLSRLKKLVEIGTRTQYNQPYPGFPCDILAGGPMCTVMPFGATYRQRRVNRVRTLAAILEGFTTVNRGTADVGRTADLCMKLEAVPAPAPDGVVFQTALDPRVTIQRVVYEWPNGESASIPVNDDETQLGYSVRRHEDSGIQIVRVRVPRSPLSGENHVKIHYDAPFEPHDPPQTT